MFNILTMIFSVSFLPCLKCLGWERDYLFSKGRPALLLESGHRGVIVGFVSTFWPSALQEGGVQGDGYGDFPWTLCFPTKQDTGQLSSVMRGVRSLRFPLFQNDHL